MHDLRVAIDVMWILFWVYWLASAFNAKERAAGSRRYARGGVPVIGLVIMLRVFRGGGTEIHSLLLGGFGVALVAGELALAVWARVHLGRNWGMPMSEAAAPELITTGPYRLIRHPIYSGLLLGVLGTALTNNLLGLIVAGVVCAYFYYAATVEERNLTAAFPTTYPAYRHATKMLIPFVL